ncbi:MAG: hypothetical protein QGG40_19260, partial [Myxococcota bacterium]|nr:hypothetical protein [Myxococcota bacterium]
SDHLASLQAAAPEALQVMVHGVLSLEEESCSGVEYGSGYAELAAVTGGELVELCESDWAEAFTQIGQSIAWSATGGTEHALEQIPVPWTLQVVVDGVTFEQWEYDEDLNALVFSDETAPTTGSTVQVSYTMAVSCGD